MAAVLAKWREASTIVLISTKIKGPRVKPVFVGSSALTNAHKGANFEVLLLKRNARSRFMPNIYVFPGGTASDADFSSEWIQVFDMIGKDQRQNLFDFVQRGGKGAPMFSRLRDEQHSYIPSEIAFRICAIRETFEESGVLIARKVETKNKFQPSLWDGQSWASCCQDEAVIGEWRERVDRDPREFLNMCQSEGMVPDVWSLYEWSNWLTPVIGKIRFDTAFYICCVDGRPHAAEDERETVHAQWGSPYDILHQYYEDKVILGPPQVHEMHRLMNFLSVQELLKRAWDQSQHRVERWMPINVVTKDVIFSVLPGDSLYPEDVDPEDNDIFYFREKTYAELAKSHANKHRMFRPSEQYAEEEKHIRIECNVLLPGNQVPPVSTITDIPLPKL